MYTAKITFGCDDLSAAQVSYTPGSVPGVSNVQDAIDALGSATPTVAPMTPVARGTAFGQIDAPSDSRNMNALGYAVNTSPGMSNCIDLYTSSPFGQVQEMIVSDSLCLDNRDIQNTNTRVSNSSAVLNENVMPGAVLSVSTIHSNQSDLTNCETLNCVLNIDNVSCNKLYAQQSVIVGSDSTLKTSTADRSVILTTRASIVGLNIEGCCIIGSLDPMNIANTAENLILASNAAGGATVNILGRQCAYLGNQARAETVNDREFVVSSYDRFFLDTLREDIGPQICYYDPTTDEITRGDPQPAPIPFVTTFSATMRPVFWDTATSTIQAVNNTALSRVFRATAASDAAGQATFTAPPGVNPTVPQTSFSATARNVSTTTFYSCTIQSVTATTIRVQAWQSVPAVLGGQPMVAAGSGISINFAMFY